MNETTAMLITVRMLLDRATDDYRIEYEDKNYMRLTDARDLVEGVLADFGINLSNQPKPL